MENPINYTAINYEWLPESLRRGMRLYIEDGIEPGGFLCAVLRNDLANATVRADPDNMLAMPKIVFFILHYAPPLCWGSEEKVKAWADARQQERG